MNKNRKVVYTCITGRYDELSNHSFTPEKGWDYICFSDINLSNEANKKWSLKQLKFRNLDNSRNQRWHKINAHQILNEYDYSLYVDANINIVSSKLFKIIDNLIEKSSRIAFPPHPQRNCIYDEFEACKELNKDDTSTMKEFMEYARGIGYPTHNGLYASGIILRRHNDEKIIKTMERWWDYIKGYSLRDQLSLPVALREEGITSDLINIGIFNKSEGVIRFWPHNYKSRAVIESLEQRLANNKNDGSFHEGRLKKLISKKRHKRRP